MKGSGCKENCTANYHFLCAKACGVLYRAADRLTVKDSTPFIFSEDMETLQVVSTDNKDIHETFDVHREGVHFLDTCGKLSKNRK